MISPTLPRRLGHPKATRPLCALFDSAHGRKAAEVLPWRGNGDIFIRYQPFGRSGLSGRSCPYSARSRRVAGRPSESILWRTRPSSRAMTTPSMPRKPVWSHVRQVPPGISSRRLVTMVGSSLSLFRQSYLPPHLRAEVDEPCGATYDPGRGSVVVTRRPRRRSSLRAMS